MKKIVLFTLLLFATGVNLLAQTNYELVQTLDFFKSHKMQSGDWMQAISESDIEGSPYLHKEFINGSIYTYQRLQFNDIPLRFNIYTGNLEFKNPEEQILALATPEIVEKAVFGNFTLSYVPYSISKRKIKKGYLKLLVEGPVSLFAQPDIVYQKPKEAAAYADAEPAKFLRRADIHFLRVGKEAAIKFDNKKELVDIFPEHKEKLTSFIKKNKVKISNEESLKELVNFYNSL